MSNTHGRVGCIHRLPAGTGRTVNINLQVVLTDLDLFGFINLRKYEHARSRRVNAPLRFSRRNTLNSVHAAFIFHVCPYAFGRFVGGSLDCYLGILVPTHIGTGGGNNLGLPALMLGITQIHAQKITREESRLVAARARFDLKNNVAAIIRITRDQKTA